MTTFRATVFSRLCDKVDRETVDRWWDHETAVERFLEGLTGFESPTLVAVELAQIVNRLERESE